MKRTIIIGAAVVGALYIIVAIGSMLIEKSITDKMPSVVFDSARAAQQSVLLRNNIGELKSTETIYRNNENRGDTIAYEIVLSGNKQRVSMKYLARKMSLSDNWIILKSDTMYSSN